MVIVVIFVNIWWVIIATKLKDRNEDMNNRDVDIDIRSVKSLDEDLEIFVFMKINTNLTEEEFDIVLSTCDDKGNDNGFM